jgi:hypothetical protein
MPLTDGENRFLQAVLHSTLGPINADWAQVAQEMSLKDGKCARERWRQICGRHGWKSASATGEKKKAVRQQAAPKKATPQKAATHKKAPVTPKKTVVKKEEEEDEEEISEEE